MRSALPKLLKPREIARLGLIRNTTNGESEDSNYAFILGLIKTGRLRAKNVGKGSRDYYLVSEVDIVAYNRNGYSRRRLKEEV